MPQILRLHLRVHGRASGGPCPHPTGAIYLPSWCPVHPPHGPHLSRTRRRPPFSYASGIPMLPCAPPPCCMLGSQVVGEPHGVGLRVQSQFFEYKEKAGEQIEGDPPRPLPLCDPCPSVTPSTPLRRCAHCSPCSELPHLHCSDCCVALILTPALHSSPHCPHSSHPQVRTRSGCLPACCSPAWIGNTTSRGLCVVPHDALGCRVPYLEMLCGVLRPAHSRCCHCTHAVCCSLLTFDAMGMLMLDLTCAA